MSDTKELGISENSFFTMTLVNCFFRGGPFDGCMSTLPRRNLVLNKDFLINGQAYYRLVDGPALAAFLKGVQCKNLAVTMEFQR